MCVGVFEPKQGNIMFVVITNGVVSYAGPNQQEAINTLGSQPGSSMHTVENYSDIGKLLGTPTPPKSEPKRETNFLDDAVKMVEFTAAASETFRTAMNKLNELGVNEELVGKVVDNANSLVGEVRSLGVKGMKTVGESFIALGDLLKNIDEPKTK